MSQQLQINETTLFARVAEIIETRKHRAASHANCEITLMYWEIGKYIGSVLLGDERAEYGKKIFSTLSRKLVEEYGKPFDKINPNYAIRKVICKMVITREIQRRRRVTIITVGGAKRNRRERDAKKDTAPQGLNKTPRSAPSGAVRMGGPPPPVSALWLCLRASTDGYYCDAPPALGSFHPDNWRARVPTRRTRGMRTKKNYCVIRYK